MTQRVVLEVSTLNQLSISVLDEDGSGHGYRIHGPKFFGDGETMMSHTVDARDIAEIRRYLSIAETLLKATQ